MSLSPRARQALEFILTNPGCTSIDVAEHLGVEHPVYGMQRAGSNAIAELRRKGKIKDCERCHECGGALSRGDRNVPLQAQ